MIKKGRLGVLSLTIGICSILISPFYILEIQEKLRETSTQLAKQAVLFRWALPTLWGLVKFHIGGKVRARFC